MGLGKNRKISVSNYVWPRGSFHLCLALIDLAGVWGTERIVREFSNFADLVIARCLSFAWQHYVEMRAQKSKPVAKSLPEFGGFFIIAFGKLGGRELNYSSDVDLAFFFDPDSAQRDEEVPSAQDYECDWAGRWLVCYLMSANTDTGFGLIFDCVPIRHPRQSLYRPKQHWDIMKVLARRGERAAWIKARVIGGNQLAGADFLEQMRPFIWRRNLDLCGH